MSIRVKGYLTIRDVIGEHYIALGEEGIYTLRDVPMKLYHQQGTETGNQFYDPQTNQVNQAIMVLVNGRNFDLLPGQLDVNLEDDDEIAIFPPIAGG